MCAKKERRRPGRRGRRAGIHSDAIRAASKLEAKEDEQKLNQLARRLERDHPSEREGLPEMFAFNRLGLTPRLRECLGSTNLIDSTHSGVRQKNHRVTNLKNGAMTSIRLPR